MPKININNSELVRAAAAEGIRVLHTDHNYRRRITVAYRVNGSSVVEIATSVASPKDTFCRKVGTQQAIANFRNGKVINVPQFRNVHGHTIGPISTLQLMFSNY